MIIPDKTYHTLIGIAFAIAVCAATVTVMSTGNLFLAGLLISIPVTILFFFNPKITLMLAIAFYASMIRPPGLPNSINLSRLLMLILLVSTAGNVILKSNSPKGEAPKLHLPLFFYLTVVIMVISTHGFGMRTLGSKMWGGGSAIAQLLLPFFFLFRKHYHLSEKQFKSTLIAMMLASSAPMLADAAYTFTSGKMTLQFFFVEPLTAALKMAISSDVYSHVWRLQRANFFATSLLALAFLMFYSGGCKKTGFILLLVTSGLTIGISGHRGVLIECLLFVIAFLLLWYNKNKTRVVIFTIIMLFSTYIFLRIVTPTLSPSFQRVVSFVPGIKVENIVEYDASGTLNWRLKFWQYAMQDWRNFFWTGKGFLHNPDVVTSLENLALYYYWVLGIDTLGFEHTLATKNYHNGPIALISDMGIFGLISGIWLIFYIVYDQYKKNKLAMWNNKNLKSLHTVLTAILVSKALAFFVIFGDTRSMLDFLFYGTLASMVLMINTDNNTNTVQRQERLE